MLKKPCILCPDYRLGEGWRNLVPGHPIESPTRFIDSHLLEDLPVPVEKKAVGFEIGRANVAVGGQGLANRTKKEETTRKDE